MRDVAIRTRADGLVELSPKLAPMPAPDRALVLATVLLGALGFFVSGLLPVEVLAAIAASCLAGEGVLAARAALLALLRPPAQVHEVPAARGRAPR